MDYDITKTTVYYSMNGNTVADVTAKVERGLAFIYQGESSIIVPEEHVGFLLDALTALFVTRDEFELADAVRGPQ